MADGRVVIDTRLDPKGAKTGMEQLPKTLAPALKKVGALIAVAFSTKKLVEFGKQAIELASDLQEVQNVVDTAFGSMAGDMEEFANKAIETYGISKLTAKKTGSTYMAMAKGMGLASANASEMSLKLTGLSADMASFHNVTQEEASTALKSVFTGETETLKKYGIVMSEVNLKAYALSQGITKDYSAMTQAEKVQLRYNYVMEQTSLAQGDFAKTSKGWANQTRILSEYWKEFMTLVGNGLIQILTPALRMLVNFVKQLTIATQKVNDMLGIKGATSEASAGITEVTGATEDLADATAEAVKESKKLLGTYDSLNVISSDTASDAGTGTLDFTDITEATEQVEATEGTISALEGALASLKQYMDANFGPTFNNLWTNFLEPFMGNVKTNFLPVVTEATREIFNSYVTALGEVMEASKTVVNEGIVPGLELIGEVWGDQMKIVKDEWDENGKVVFDKLNEAIKNTSEAFDTAWTTVYKPIIDLIIENARELWENSLKPLYKNIAGLVSDLAKLILDLYNRVLVPIVQYIVRVCGSDLVRAIENLFRIIMPYANNVVTAVNGIITAIRGVVRFINGITNGDWKMAWEGLVMVFKGIWQALSNFVKAPFNLIIAMVNLMLKSIKTAINGVVDAVNAMSFKVPNWVPGIGGQNFGFDLKKVSIPEIPYLASGAVLPANSPFMAVVGDQKHGTNVEAPLDTIVEAMSIALAKNSGSDGEINLYIDGDKLFTWTKNKNNEYKNRYGTSAFA